MAQVNAWYVCAARKHLAGVGLRPEFAEDVRRLVGNFLGDCKPIKQDNIILAHTMGAVTGAQRLRDRRAALKYYLDLIKAAAEMGAHELELTREVAEAAPNYTGGESIHIGHVSSMLEKCGYYVQDREGDDDFENHLSDPQFPYLVSWTRAHNDDSWKDVNDAAARGSRESEKTNRGDETLTRRARLLVDTLHKTRQEILERIAAKMDAAVSAGDVQLVFTREDWEQMPHLPNGKEYPINSFRVRRLHNQLNKAQVSLLWTLDLRMDDILVEDILAKDAAEDPFPLVLRLKSSDVMNIPPPTR